MSGRAQTVLRAGLAVLGVICLLIAGCRAPRWVGGSPQSPQVNAEGWKRVGDALALTDEQRATAGELLRAYQADYLRAAGQIERFDRAFFDMAAARPGDDALVGRRVRAYERFAAHAAGLQDRLMEDLRLLLTPEQAARLPAAERALRRSQLLGGAYEERSADLIELTAAMDLSAQERAAIAPVLDEYEQAIDPLLIRKDAFIRGNLAAEIRADAADKGGGNAQRFKRWRLIVREERAVNRRFVAQLAERLPEGFSAALKRGAFRGTYRGVYEEPDIEKKISAALADPAGIPGATPEQRDAAAALLGEFRRDRLALADRAADLLDKWEREADDDALMGEPGPAGELKALLAKVEALERQTLTRLAERLSAEQLDAIGIRGHRRSLPELDFDAAAPPETRTKSIP
ncbi:MAG: hypothetical protein IBJ11_05080 [Phycisphaerales bacterium]|nr:hypothetical protein [Phycisphaerales bacterium]